MGAGLSVLVVDDEPAVGVAIERQLTILGHDTHWVSGGEQALEQMESGAYDMVFCDLVMPDTDGHDLLLEANKRGIAVPFVMMSGRADIHDAVQAQRAGTTDFLIKPISRRQLERTIERARAPVPHGLEETPSGVHRRRRDLIVDQVARRHRGRRDRSPDLARLVELFDRRPLKANTVLAVVASDPFLAATVVRRAQILGGGARDVEGAVTALGPLTALSTAVARQLRGAYTGEDPSRQAAELQLWCVHYVAASIVELAAVALAWPRPVRMQAMMLVAQLGELEAGRAARALWPAAFERGAAEWDPCAAVSEAAAGALEAVGEAWDLPGYFISFARAWYGPVDEIASSGQRRVIELGRWARYRAELALGAPPRCAAPFAAAPSGTIGRMADLLVEKAVERVVVFG